MVESKAIDPSEAIGAIGVMEGIVSPAALINASKFKKLESISIRNHPCIFRMAATKKAKIPQALREEVWRHWMGERFKGKCSVTWCTNQITAFDFAVGHNVPESRGGPLELSNLRAICTRCNLSMGAHYTIDEWNLIVKNPVPWYMCCCAPSIVVPPEIIQGVVPTPK